MSLCLRSDVMTSVSKVSRRSFVMRILNVIAHSRSALGMIFSMFHYIRPMVILMTCAVPMCTPVCQRFMLLPYRTLFVCFLCGIT